MSLRLIPLYNVKTKEQQQIFKAYGFSIRRVAEAVSVKRGVGVFFFFFFFFFFQHHRSFVGQIRIKANIKKLSL